MQSLGGKGAILLISLWNLRKDMLFFRMHSAAMDVRHAMEALKAPGMAARVCVYVCGDIERARERLTCRPTRRPSPAHCLCSCMASRTCSPPAICKELWFYAAHR